MPDQWPDNARRQAIAIARKVVLSTVQQLTSVDGCAGLPAAKLEQLLRDVTNQTSERRKDLDALLFETFGQKSDEMVRDFRESFRLFAEPTAAPKLTDSNLGHCAIPESLRMDLTGMDNEVTRRIHLLRRTVEVLSNRSPVEASIPAPVRGIGGKIREFKAKRAIRIAHGNCRRAVKSGQRLAVASPVEPMERRLAGRQAVRLIGRIKESREELERRWLEGTAKDMYELSSLPDTKGKTRWQEKLLNDDRLVLGTLNELFLFCDHLITRTIKALNDTRREGQPVVLDRLGKEERKETVATIARRIHREQAVLRRLLDLCYPLDPGRTRSPSKAAFVIPGEVPPEIQRAMGFAMESSEKFLKEVAQLSEQTTQRQPALPNGLRLCAPAKIRIGRGKRH